MKTHTSACLIAVFTSLTIFSFIGIVRCAFSPQTIQKARCYAHCLTLYNPRLPDVGCHSENCRQCASACEVISLSLANCNASCQNSSICRQNCEYIDSINKWNDVTVSNTLIQGPPVPTVQNKSVRSLTLSWQPGVQNVSDGAVYLLKRRTDQNIITEYTIVFTVPSAELNTRQVCQSVKIDWPSRAVQFYFSVVALTENSTLVEGRESGAIEMMKPGQFDISFPVFTYDKESSLNKLILTTSITPSPDLVSIVTNYGIRWQIQDRPCQADVRLDPLTNIKVSKISLRLFEKLKQCNQSLQAYQQVECVASTVKIIFFKYPGCMNIPSFDKELCYTFDPPPTPDSSRSVGNLTHGDVHIEPDFRFRVNITWLKPALSYVSPKGYIVRIINGSNPEFVQVTLFVMKDLLPERKFIVKVEPYFPSKYKGTKAISSEIVFSTPRVPLEQLSVRDVQVLSYGLSNTCYYSYNITWKKQTFAYGTFEGYDYKMTHGNVTRSNVTTNTFVVINDMQHSESRTFKIEPIYKEAWITGVAIKKTIEAPDQSKALLKSKDWTRTKSLFSSRHFIQ